MTCLAPFLQSPRVQLGYLLTGQSCNQNLLLPITLSKFFVAPEAPIPREAFFARWRALTGDLWLVRQDLFGTLRLLVLAIYNSEQKRLLASLSKGKLLLPLGKRGERKM